MLLNSSSRFPFLVLTVTLVKKKHVSLCAYVFFTGGTHVCQTRDEDEGPRRVWPGQLEPDLAYLAEARRDFDR